MKSVARTLRRRIGMAWHLCGHVLPILRRSLRIRRRRGKVVFIDLGAADGDTAEQALAVFSRLDRLILFEPARERFRRLKEGFGDRPRVELFQAAAGPCAIPSARLYHERFVEGKPFYQGQGDSLHARKPNVASDDFEEVSVVAFPSFLLENTAPDDRVILKMDIEGGEYDLLEAMVQNGSIDRVSALYCEWHGTKLGIPPGRHRALVRALQQRGMPVTGLNRYDEFRLRRREHP